MTTWRGNGRNQTSQPVGPGLTAEPGVPQAADPAQPRCPCACTRLCGRPLRAVRRKPCNMSAFPCETHRVTSLPIKQTEGGRQSAFPGKQTHLKGAPFLEGDRSKGRGAVHFLQKFSHLLRVLTPHTVGTWRVGWCLVGAVFLLHPSIQAGSWLLS